MRIFFLLVDEPFYTPDCLAPLLERWGSSVVGAAFPSGFFDWKRVRTTVSLYGLIGTATRSVRMAWASVGGGVVHRQFKERGVPVLDVADVNAPAFLDELRRLKADLVVSLNTPQKLKAPLLALPAHGCINVHFGMLPRYRGILPIFYALMNGDPAFGVTVHVMDAQLDNGEILAQRAVPIGAGDDLETLYPKGFAAASALLDETLQQIDAGTVVRRPNPASEKTYYSYPSQDLIRRYHARIRT
jgi:folate-dependent phosphoribosylglycinamide formyltransferase PurN